MSFAYPVIALIVPKRPATQWVHCPRAPRSRMEGPRNRLCVAPAEPRDRCWAPGPVGCPQAGTAGGSEGPDTMLGYMGEGRVRAGGQSSAQS